MTIKMIFVVSRDIEKMKNFYQSVLGANLRFQDDDKWCQLNAGKIDLAFGNAQESHPIKEGSVAVYEVEDIENSGKLVQGSGGEIVELRDMGAHGKVVTCKDIEGNYFQLFSKN